MTGLLLLASVVGAVLFFAAGFFIARDRAGRIQAEIAPGPAAGEGQQVRSTERAMLARTTAEFKKVEAERGAAENEVAKLKKQLDHLKSSKGPDKQVSLLKTQVSQLQLALDGADSAKTKLMAEISRLKGELEARLMQQSRESSAAAPTLPVGDLERDGGSIDHYLERLCERGGARGAVVADSAGLMVSGAGLGNEALAALAAATYQSGSSAADLVAMGPLRHMTLTDGTDLTFTAMPFQFSGNTLILATLSTGPMARETVAPVLLRASDLLK